MALFDKIGKTFTEAGQKAIAKTKDFADTTRLNSLINDEEKKLSNLYMQIGKLYVAQHRNDCEEAFAGALAAVAESEEKIAECKESYTGQYLKPLLEKGEDHGKSNCS